MSIYILKMTTWQFSIKSLNDPHGLIVRQWKEWFVLPGVRRKKHRGRKKHTDEPVSIEHIESRFEERLETRKLLAEAFLQGKNKYGLPDLTPTKVIL